jgi:hypothetical protein
LARIKETVKRNNPKSKATVVCRFNKLSTLILNGIIAATGRKMKLFDDVDDVDDAIAWLHAHETMQSVTGVASHDRN